MLPPLLIKAVRSEMSTNKYLRVKKDTYVYKAVYCENKIVLHISNIFFKKVNDVCILYIVLLSEVTGTFYTV